MILLAEAFLREGDPVAGVLPRTGTRGSVHEISGTRPNVEMAAHVYAFLLATAERLWRANRGDARVRSGRDRLSYHRASCAVFARSSASSAPSCAVRGSCGAATRSSMTSIARGIRGSPRAAPASGSTARTPRAVRPGARSCCTAPSRARQRPDAPAALGAPQRAVVPASRYVHAAHADRCRAVQPRSCTPSTSGSSRSPPQRQGRGHQPRDQPAHGKLSAADAELVVAIAQLAVAADRVDDPDEQALFQQLAGHIYEHANVKTTPPTLGPVEDAEARIDHLRTPRRPSSRARRARRSRTRSRTSSRIFRHGSRSRGGRAARHPARGRSASTRRRPRICLPIVRRADHAARVSR